MVALPDNMNWKAFGDYAALQYLWLAATLDDFFPEYKKDSEPMTFRRIDHILSDIEVEGDKIIIRIQEGDSFLEGIEVYISMLNGLIRKKYDCFFATKQVDYF